MCTNFTYKYQISKYPAYVYIKIWPTFRVSFKRTNDHFRLLRPPLSQFSKFSELFNQYCDSSELMTCEFYLIHSKCSLDKSAKLKDRHQITQTSKKSWHSHYLIILPDELYDVRRVISQSPHNWTFNEFTQLFINFFLTLSDGKYDIDLLFSYFVCQLTDGRIVLEKQRHAIILKTKCTI